MEEDEKRGKGRGVMGGKTGKPPKIFEPGNTYGRTLLCILDERVVWAAEIDDGVASLATANCKHDEHDCDH